MKVKDKAGGWLGLPYLAQGDPLATPKHLAVQPTFKGCLQLIDILGQILGLMSDTQKEFLEKSNTCEATP